MDLQSINASIIKECAKELQIPVVREEAQTKKQAFSQKKVNKEPKKTSKYRFSKIMVATIVLIVLAWGMAGSSFYRSKIGKSILSEYLLNPVEKSDYTAKQHEDVSTRTSLANESTIADQNNNRWNQRKKLIYFNHDSNDLHSESLKDLDKLFKLILQHPDSKIIIEGYADSNGNYWYNKKLSKIRAEIVKSYLVEKGISPLKIEAVGMGAQNPIASNDTSAGRKKNRRVEIRIHSN